MNILFANARPLYPFSIGGDAVSTHTLLRYLSKNHTCLAVGAQNTTGAYYRLGFMSIVQTLRQMGIPYRLGGGNKTMPPYLSISYVSGFPCRLFPTRVLIKELPTLITSFRPDIIITQLDGAEDVLRIAHIHNIPSAVFICDAESQNYTLLHQASKYHCAAILYFSAYLKHRFSSLFQGQQFVVYPSVRHEDYSVQRNNPQYITVINPIMLKGGEVLKRIIPHFPKERFLVVKGWHDPLRDDLHFDSFPNVKIIEKQFDMRSVYKETKILLVPSLWNEAFPRVIVEAGLNGIPSIASKRGGIPEAVGEGGILINNPLNIPSWRRAITTLLSKNSQYVSMSRAIRKRSRRFCVSVIGPIFERQLHKIKAHGS